MKKLEIGCNRIFDILVSLLFLVIFSWLFALIAALVRLTSPGPVIFSQKRVGHLGEIFTIYKFRTLRDGSGKEGLDFVVKGDARITKAGKILRPTRLDELPQLWNVLLGDMSLVGPRPLREGEIKIMYRKIKGYYRRLKARPGITGIAQISDAFNKSIEGYEKTFNEELQYVEKQCVFLDIVILLKTILVVLKRKGI